MSPRRAKGVKGRVGDDPATALRKHLIDVVGRGGGFILSSGCEVPYNAKAENVAALIETGKTHLPR